MREGDEVGEKEDDDREDRQQAVCLTSAIISGSHAACAHCSPLIILYAI